MQISQGLQPTYLPTYRPILSAPAPKPSSDLQSTPIPADLGLKEVDRAEGSLAYSGPPVLRQKLLAGKISLIGLRHGQTEANALAEKGPPVVCGQVETALTPKGRQQAAEAAQQLFSQLGGQAWLEKAAQDPSLLPVLLSSPLSRAHDTAQALVDLVREKSDGRVQLPITHDPRLLELNFGRYEMKRVTELSKEQPELAARWDSHKGSGIDFQHRFPGGESRLDVTARVAGLLQELPQKYPGRTVLLVCHQETLVAARTALGFSKQRDGRLRADSQEIQNASPLRLL